jgi:hypothetical protein
MRRFAKCSGSFALSLSLVSLAGCSEYVTRSDLISPQGGDAVSRNKVVQMVDPWPRASAERNIAYDGAVMRRAVERYRTGHVIAPKGTGTSNAYDAPQSNGSQDDPTAAQASQAAAK